MAGNRHADIERAIDIGRPARIILGFGLGIGQLALEVGERANLGGRAGARLVAQIVRQQVAAGAKVVAAGQADIAVEHEIADHRHRQGQRGRAFVGGGGIAEQGDRVERLLDPARDPRIDHIDHPADRR